jgi:hypothetical protein
LARPFRLTSTVNMVGHMGEAEVGHISIGPQESIGLAIFRLTSASPKWPTVFTVLPTVNLLIFDEENHLYNFKASSIKKSSQLKFLTEIFSLSRFLIKTQTLRFTTSKAEFI